MIAKKTLSKVLELTVKLLRPIAELGFTLISSITLEMKMKMAMEIKVNMKIDMQMEMAMEMKWL
ncbi:hypothetical protein AXX17_AT1G31500 [Arabidopsis thaliana]|uniref:Uncharacterized protein n=1 Tax=Arabidopsis thaliana TaxID=3702 RepID=A0A178WCH9_ARATH|nr:hypothetical protein AXX17_AT1G31500 [Arabidopsis thaliana]